MSRVYDDAYDEGFYLTSVRTGEKKLFVLYDTLVKEGDVMGWEFKSEDGLYKALIAND